MYDRNAQRQKNLDTFGAESFITINAEGIMVDAVAEDVEDVVVDTWQRTWWIWKA